MSILNLQSHFGFTTMPFGRTLAPSMLHRHAGHAEAVARISWCVDQHALGVVTGEVGAGKTVAARAATAAIDTSRHVVIYLPSPSGRSPASTPPPWSPKPRPPWPPNTPNAAAPWS